MRQDATLFDVHFFDEKRGWAVGDRGTIWHTRDGGRHWELQHSGVACRLRRVQFIDANNGWVAGGYTEPASHVSRGVLLTTNNGGQTWTPLPTPLVSEFLDFGMRDGRSGWAITRSSAVHPIGILETNDGGRGWSPTGATLDASWQTADLTNPSSGVVAGTLAQIGFVRRTAGGQISLKPSRTDLTGLRNIRALKMADKQTGYLVGDGGLVMQTPDGGGSWQAPASLSAAASELFDWKTIATHEANIWIAGSPGTHVLHSSDGGKSWQWQETEHPLPIRSLHFFDEKHGWAVGALGNILATRDGGRSWRPQRSGGTRLAWLGAFVDADAVPLEVVARLSAGEGYYGGVLAIGCRDFDRADRSGDELARATEALTRSGAGHFEQLWQFPLRQTALHESSSAITQTWDDVHGDGLAQLEEQLVRRIRVWRPTVIVTQSPAGQPGGDIGILRQVLLRSIRSAADPRQYPHHIQDMNLPAWRVPKVYAASPAQRTGRTGLSTGQFMPRLGQSLYGYVAGARGLLPEDKQTAPVAYRYEPLVEDTANGSIRDDLFFGRHLPPDGDARRQLAAAPAIPLVNLRRLADRRRALPALLARASQDAAARAPWRNKVIDILRDLDSKIAAEMLFQLGREYARAGHTHLASESYALVAELYPNSPQASAARMRLVQHYASGEFRSRPRAREAVPIADSGPRTIGGRVVRPQTSPPLTQTEPRGVRQVGLLEATSASDAQTAIRWADELEGLDPVLFADPRVQLPLAAAYRKAGKLRDAERVLIAIGRTRPYDAWRNIADDELDLIRAMSQTNGVAPEKPGDRRDPLIWMCERAGEKPRLDGNLEDACWQRVAKNDDGTTATTEFVLKSDHDTEFEDTQWPAITKLIYDDEFLYFAARCSKAEGVNYTKTDTPRQNDTDLSLRDRVTLRLDIDRDYATYFELTVDSRGWMAERVGNNTHWNPKWFVAHSEDETSWTCEVAIPWSELGIKPPAKSQASLPVHLAVDLQRTIPGVDFQSARGTSAADAGATGLRLLRLE